MRIEDVLERLHGVTGGNGQWHARCPAHDDHSASLTIGIGRDGRILVTCWAGCELDAIVRALGVSVPDLFNGGGAVRAAPWGNRTLGETLRLLPSEDDLERWAGALMRDDAVLAKIEELKGWTRGALAVLGIGLKGDRLTIPIRTLDGELVNVLRYWPERHPKVIASKGHPRAPLYALVDDTGPIYVVEGETDAVAMVCAGFNVIGAPGASAKARAEWLEVVKGRDVVICFDVDEPGRRAAQRWALASRDANAASVRVITLEGPSGYDVGNMLVETRNPSAFRRRLHELTAAAPAWEPVTRVETPSSNGRELDVAPEGSKPGEMILTSLSSIVAEPVRMLWRDRIPAGRVGIVYGPPGLGKSTLIALLAADITQRGGHVILASAEDDPQTTILPRMMGAGADVGLVNLISIATEKRGETALVLPRDLDELERMMQSAALLVIDPLSASLGDDVNAWSEQSVRSRVLAPLQAISRRTGCAAALIMHMNKSNGTDALSRISGSGGFGGAARFALLLGSHPDDIGLDEAERRVVLVHVKASEGARQLAMVFRRRIVGVDIGVHGVASVPVLELAESQASISAEAVLEHTDPDDASAYSEAMEFLRLELADGPKLAKRLLATARERGDFSERTLRKAKRALKAASVKDTDGWWWERTA